MASVIDFGPHAMASLRARVAEVEEANRDLVAFARGHSGAVSAIHAAVLEAMAADGFDHLIHVVTQLWPDVLGLDSVALALVAGDTAIRADASGMQFVEARVLGRSIEAVDAVVLRNVDRGHPLFGPAAELIRAEALIRLEGPDPLPAGLLLLGQRRAQGFETRAGSELLVFLGRVISRMIGRWLLP
jgi:uncharacterized protein YigA (DUF484 family)